MERVTQKSWLILGFLGFAVLLMIWLRLAPKVGFQFSNEMGFTYEMPRPVNEEQGFDLSGLEVKRQYKTLPPAPDKMMKAADAKKNAVDPLKAKKDKEAAAKKAALERQKALAKRKAQLKVDVVNTQRQSQFSAEVIQAAPQDVWTSGAVQAAAPTKQGSANTDEKDKKEDEELTPSQWRALLQSQPTSTNLAKFLKAKRQGKVETTVYYQIIHELLTDSAEDRKKAALNLLDQDSSAASFEFMVTEQAQVPADVQASLKTRIDAYSDPTKLGFLAAALSTSKSAAVLSAALGRLSVALSEFKKTSSTSTTGPGGQQSARLERMQDNVKSYSAPQVTRNTGGTGKYSVALFNAFIPALQRLSKSGESVATQAAQLLADIQNLSKSKS